MPSMICVAGNRRMRSPLQTTPGSFPATFLLRAVFASAARAAAGELDRGVGSGVKVIADATGDNDGVSKWGAACG